MGGAASSTHGLVRRTRVSPNLPYFCICDSSGWASVNIRPRKACKYSNLRSFGWVSYDKVGVLYSGKLGSRSEARASDLRSYPRLWWKRIKLHLYEGMKLSTLRGPAQLADLQGALCVRDVELLKRGVLQGKKWRTSAATCLVCNLLQRKQQQIVVCMRSWYDPHLEKVPHRISADV